MRQTLADFVCQGIDSVGIFDFFVVLFAAAYAREIALLPQSRGLNALCLCRPQWCRFSFDYSAVKWIPITSNQSRRIRMPGVNWSSKSCPLLSCSRSYSLSRSDSLVRSLALTPSRSYSISHSLSLSLSLVLSLFVSLSDHQRSTRDSRLPETLRVIKTSLAKLLPLLWSPLSRDKLHTCGILQTNKTNASTIFSIWCVRRLLLSLFVYLEKQHLSSLPPMIGDITWQVNLHFTAH